MVSLDGGSAGKVDDVTACRAVQDGGYALPWQRYDNKMAAICYYVLHLQQHSHRLNLLYFFVKLERGIVMQRQANETVGPTGIATRRQNLLLTLHFHFPVTDSFAFKDSRHKITICPGYLISSYLHVK